MGVVFVCKKCGKSVHLAGDVNEMKQPRLCYECTTNRRRKGKTEKE
jgi:DNA replicative helicase MCM subunit Mcm2 (Cdc46/Mcm family)